MDRLASIQPHLIKPMPYRNTVAGTFGHTIDDVRASNPNTSVPEGLSCGDFVWYDPVDPPAGHPLQIPQELAPVGGAQRWALSALAPGPLVPWLRSQLALQYEQRMQVIASGYPPTERESWPVQTGEARALLSDAAASTPWIDAAAAARGLDRADLAARIVAKDNVYRSIHGAFTGVRQRIEDDITAAGADVVALLAIDVSAGWPG